MDKISVQIFKPTPPGEGGIKNEVIEKSLRELKLQNMNFRTHKNKTKSKNLANYRIFCESSQAKSQFCQFFKSQNLIQFLRFRSNLHVSSISISLPHTPTPFSMLGLMHTSTPKKSFGLEQGHWICKVLPHNL